MRNKNIDLLKGVAILFVIYYHLVWNGMALSASPSALFFQTVCMQLFFMISGYLSFKRKDNNIYSLKGTIGILNRKISTLLVPTISMFLFSIWYFDIPLWTGLTDIHKNGYWFTYILFILIVLRVLIVKPIEKKWDKKVVDILVIVASFLMMVSSLLSGKIFGKEWSHLLSLSFILKYWFFFIGGYYLSKYYPEINAFFSRKYVRVILLFLAFIPLNSIDDAFKRYLLECFVAPARVLVVFYIFMEISICKDGNFIVSELMRFGRHSLEIYFLQFYFIFGMPEIAQFINNQKEIIFGLQHCGATLPVELLIVIPVSVFISYTCLLTRKIVNFAPPISRMFLGPIVMD